jgi:nucleoside-diphosphate-sugar epimerase
LDVVIDDAVAAAVAALTAEPGVYNIVDDDPLPVAEWLPAFAPLGRCAGAAAVECRKRTEDGR